MRGYSQGAKRPAPSLLRIVTALLKTLVFIITKIGAAFILHCVMNTAATVEFIKDHCAKVGMALPDREYVGGPDYYVCWSRARVRIRFEADEPLTWCILYYGPTMRRRTKYFTEFDDAFARLQQVHTNSIRYGGHVSRFFHI